MSIALVFGLTLLALAYALEPISGSHVNPAVTLGMLLARRIPVRTAVQYWVAQLLGAIAGAALLLLVLAGFDGLLIGVALAVANLVGLPLTGASVNPARSLAPAVFAGPAALTPIWLFLIAPLVGGAIAAAVHRVTHPTAPP